MFARFAVLPFEGKAARKAMREAAKLNLPKLPNPHKKLFDLMIAATAWAHNRAILKTASPPGPGPAGPRP